MKARGPVVSLVDDVPPTMAVQVLTEDGADDIATRRIVIDAGPHDPPAVSEPPPEFHPANRDERRWVRKLERKGALRRAK